MQLKIGSLCTGIAGLELGLEYAGVKAETVFVSDIDPNICNWLNPGSRSKRPLGVVNREYIGRIGGGGSSFG